MKYRFMERHKDMFKVKRMTTVLGVSRSGYYAARHRKPSEGFVRRTELTSQIQVVHDASRQTYGSPRVHVELHAQGVPCCENTVAKLMRQAKIAPKSISRFRVTTDSRNTKASPNLLRRAFNVDRPNHSWVSDITFIPTREGWLYLAAILDWHSRFVLSWRLSNTLDVGFCLEALEEALSQSRPEIFNTDQGVQFTSEAFTSRLLDSAVRISMDGKGRALDNVFVERLWRTVKYEEVFIKAYETAREAEANLAAYFRYYNEERFHSRLANCTPGAVYRKRQ